MFAHIDVQYSTVYCVYSACFASVFSGSADKLYEHVEIFVREWCRYEASKRNV